MEEYISRSAALKICEDTYQERLRMADYCGDTVAWNIGHAIKALPSANVVPVVRCKDCKHKDPENNHCDHMMGTAIMFPRELDDFCSYGEREDGDGK